MAATRDYLNIVDVGKILQGSQKGIRVGEHPAFGGVAPVHSPQGYHPTGEAIDVTDWNDEVIGGADWKKRTADRRDRARALGFSETLGPGEKGHDTHWHLALSEKDAASKRFTKEEILWMATGQGPTPERVKGKLAGAPGAPAGGGSSSAPAPAPEDRSSGVGSDGLSPYQRTLLESLKAGPQIAIPTPTPAAIQGPSAQIQNPIASGISQIAAGFGGAEPPRPSENRRRPDDQSDPRFSKNRRRPSLMEQMGYSLEDFRPEDRGALNGTRNPRRPVEPLILSV